MGSERASETPLNEQLATVERLQARYYAWQGMLASYNMILPPPPPHAGSMHVHGMQASMWEACEHAFLPRGPDLT